MKNYLLAHDLGTSGNKAVLYSEDGRLVASAVYNYETFYTRNRWVEQNPEDWWRSVCLSTKNLLEQSDVSPYEIACLCFSAQMMGCLLVDEKGKALRNMITWADSRSYEQEKWMLHQTQGLEKPYRITGHRISASYSAAKLLWIKENEPQIYNKAAKMIHAKDYIIARLTGKILTDYSDASGTNLLDINTLSWAEDLVHAFGIRSNLLPEIHSSTDIAGHVTVEAAKACGLAEGTPVVVGGGDGSCAAVGAGVLVQGKTYNVIGTSSWISTAACEPVFDKEMRTFNWIHLNPALYTPCGTMQAAGLSYQWYKNVLCGDEIVKAKALGKSPYALLDEAVSESFAGAGGVLFLPHLIGERSPFWNLDARGCFVGLSASTSKADMTRAVLEGVGLNLRVIMESLEQKLDIEDIIMIGGGAKGRVWLQILADIWQKNLQIPAHREEATSLGAAICGGIGIGMYESFSACADLNPIVETIEPNLQNAGLYDRLYYIFKKAYHQMETVCSDLAEYNKQVGKGK